MSNPNYVYIVQRKIEGSSIQYSFMSKGKNNIIKIIEYSYVQEYIGKQLYNLGFGDFDLEGGAFFDDPISCNGDHYRVFNTVLQSIPDFFAFYPDVLLMVRGSDSKPEFIQECRVNCKKKCPEGQCKNSHRRINIYRRYVDMNYSALKTQYTFYGGNETSYNQFIMEDYQRDKKYDSVFLSKKEM